MDEEGKTMNTTPEQRKALNTLKKCVDAHERFYYGNDGGGGAALALIESALSTPVTQPATHNLSDKDVLLSARIASETVLGRTEDSFWNEEENPDLKVFVIFGRLLLFRVESETENLRVIPAKYGFNADQASGFYVALDLISGKRTEADIQISEPPSTPSGSLAEVREALEFAKRRISYLSGGVERNYQHDEAVVFPRINEALRILDAHTSPVKAVDRQKALARFKAHWCAVIDFSDVYHRFLKNPTLQSSQEEMEKWMVSMRNGLDIDDLDAIRQALQAGDDYEAEWFFRWAARAKGDAYNLTAEEAINVIWNAPGNPYFEKNPWAKIGKDGAG